MKSNVGCADRVVRIVIGAALFAASMTTKSFGLWGLIGVIPLITGWMQFCPLYALVGFSTCKTATNS